MGIEHIHRIIGYPERLNNRLLEQKDSQEGIQILHLQEKERIFIPLRSEEQESSEETTPLCVCEDSAGVKMSKSFEDSRREVQRDNALCA